MINWSLITRPSKNLPFHLKKTKYGTLGNKNKFSFDKSRIRVLIQCLWLIPQKSKNDRLYYTNWLWYAMNKFCCGSIGCVNWKKKSACFETPPPIKKKKHHTRQSILWKLIEENKLCTSHFFTLMTKSCFWRKEEKYWKLVKHSFYLKSRMSVYLRIYCTCR